MLSTVLMMWLMARVFLAVAGESNWDQSTRDFIVEIHNKRRVNEGGCHINKLVYDQELERQARYWAERCVFKHENKDGRGENLAWDTKKSAETELITTAADAWFEEKNTYSYGQRSCGSPYPACHYTQMVWGSTNKVGCYSTRCANLGQAAPNAWYLVCFYTPKGNWIGEKPYGKGCATPCLEGQTEDNGLCVGEATAAKAEEEAATACENKDALCTRWAQHNQCAENAEFMKKSCKKACNLC